MGCNPLFAFRLLFHHTLVQSGRNQRTNKVKDSQNKPRQTAHRINRCVPQEQSQLSFQAHNLCGRHGGRPSIARLIVPALSRPRGPASVRAASRPPHERRVEKATVRPAYLGVTWRVWVTGLTAARTLAASWTLRSVSLRRRVSIAPARPTSRIGTSSAPAPERRRADRVP